MNVFERVDSANLERFFRLGSSLETCSLTGTKKFIHLVEDKTAGATIRQRRIIASNVASAGIDGGYIQQDMFMLDKITNILTVLGYAELATELGNYTNKIYRSKESMHDMLNELIDGAIKKNRSDAASGYRHYLSDEILAIMKATWNKNPALSKKKMIAKLMIRYEGRVDEGTLNSWIKKEKLLPPKPKKYLISDLVIPSEYA